jgi:cyanophycin synthetase
VVDDCHNSSALAEVVKALDRFPEKRRTAVYSAGDERRDEDIVRQGRQLAEAFDRVIIYEDYSASDRAAGELTNLFRQGLAAGGRVTEVLEIREQPQAVQTALSLAGEGELVLIQPEEGDIEASLKLVQQIALRQVPEESGCLMESGEGLEGAAPRQR